MNKVVLGFLFVMGLVFTSHADAKWEMILAVNDWNQIESSSQLRIADVINCDFRFSFGEPENPRIYLANDISIASIQYHGAERLSDGTIRVTSIEATTNGNQNLGLSNDKPSRFGGVEAKGEIIDAKGKVISLIFPSSAGRVRLEKRCN